MIFMVNGGDIRIEHTFFDIITRYLFNFHIINFRGVVSSILSVFTIRTEPHFSPIMLVYVKSDLPTFLILLFTPYYFTDYTI